MFEFQIFNDLDSNDTYSSHNHSDNLTDSIESLLVDKSNVESYASDENMPLYTSLDQQFEDLLMVSSLSSSSSSFVSDITPIEFENPFYDYFQSQRSNISPVSNNLDIFHDQTGVDSDYNSLDDYSSISNIIYTNKMKEKLRKKRHSSIDIPPTKINKSVNSHTRSRSKTVVSSLNLKCQSAIRAKSCSSMSSQSLLSLSQTNSPASSTTSLKNLSPSTKAVNPFYQPPAILRQLSSSEL